MSGDITEVIQHVNELVKEWIGLTQELKAKRAAYAQEEAVRKATHANECMTLEGQISIKYRELLDFIIEHRPELIKPGKKSFVTNAATFQFHIVRGRTKVLDKDEIMKRARKLHIVRHIATPPRKGWELVPKLFLDYLEKNGEMRAEFEPWIEEGEDREELTIKPNLGYDVTHSTERLSPHPVNKN